MLTLAVVALLAARAPAPKPIETRHLTLSTSSSADVVTAGRKASLFIDVTPKPTMHVYSPGQQGYIAITLTLDANPSVTAAKPRYPAGEKYFMAALNETQLVYARPFRITQDITVTPAAPDGPIVIKGTVRYQACDDKICYLPQNVPVEWTLRRSAQDEPSR